MSDRYAISEHGDLYVDRNGAKFTNATFAMDGDPWQGATILTPGIVYDLRHLGLLPLTEVIRWIPKKDERTRWQKWWSKVSWK